MKEKKNFNKLMIFAIAVTMCLSALALLPTASADCPDDCPTGMVSYWQLDEASGTTAYDCYGSNDGTNHGATINQPGQVNQAYDFDGINGYIDCGNDGSLLIYGDISVTFWLKIDSIIVNSYLVAFTGSGESEGVNLLYGANLRNTGDIFIGHEYGSGLNAIKTYNTNLITNKWYHIALVRNTYANTWSLFIDGVQFGSLYSYPSEATGGTAGKLYIGKNPAGPVFNGLIDEIAIFDRALSDSEIGGLYQKSSIGHGYCDCPEGCPDGMVSYWKLDEASDVTVVDSYGYNFGTNHGATPTTGQVGGGLGEIIKVTEFAPAGTSASFTWPTHIGFFNGFEIISDLKNNRFLYRSEGSTGEWSVSPIDVQGHHSLTYKDGFYYADDTDHHRIIKFPDLSDSAITASTSTIAGKTLNRPHDILLDPATGYLYVINPYDGILLRFKDIGVDETYLDLGSVLGTYSRSLSLVDGKVYVVASTSPRKVIRIDDFDSGDYTIYMDGSGVLNDVEYYNGYWYGSAWVTGSDRITRWKTWADFENGNWEDLSYILPGPSNVVPYYFTVRNDKLYFAAFDPGTPGANDKIYILEETTSPIGALDFDGIDDYVTVTDTPFQLSTGTVEAWVYALSTDSRRHILGKDLPGYKDDIKLGINADGKGANKMVLSFNRDSDDIIVSVTDSTNFPTDEWVHVAGTWSNSGIELFINGVSVGTDGNVVQVVASGANLLIGNNRIDESFHWNGAIDEVAIYDQALSPSEISSHYYAGLAGHGYCDCPDTIYVDDEYNSGTSGWQYDHFDNIQDGVDKVCEGGIVHVEDGDYYENVIVHVQDVTVQAVNPPTSTAIIYGTVDITANGVTFENFKVMPTATYTTDEAAIAVYASDVVVNNNIIDGITGDGSNYFTIKGIHIYSSSGISNIDLTNNIIQNVENQGTSTVPYGGADGIMIQGVIDGVDVLGNTIGDIHSAGWAYGIEVTPTASAPLNPPQNIIIRENNILSVNDGSVYNVMADPYSAPYPGVGFSLDETYPGAGDGDASEVIVNCNSFVNTPAGAVNKDPIHILDAECNWWDDCTGPYEGTLNPGGLGCNVLGLVDFDPWVGQMTIDIGGPYVDDDCNDYYTIYFDASGTIAPICCSGIVSYIWDFGDGDTGTGINPSHTYNNYGEYTVELTVVVQALGQTCADSMTTTATVYHVSAEANGPYNANDGNSYTVDFSSLGSEGYEEPLQYTWDFGDGETSTDADPTHTYIPIEEQEYDVTVTLTVTDNTGTCVDVDTTTVHIGTYQDPPIIQIIKPTDGETINGKVTIKWYAIDDDYPGGQGIPIYLYYKPTDAGSSEWRQINDVLTNNIDVEHGSYEWDTNSFADDSYILLAEAVDLEGNIAHDSIEITIGNGNAGMMVSDVQITDTSIDSYKYVKNGDTVLISAGITGNGDITEADITADLSGFGLGGQTLANSFDGFTATWTINNVICHPSDGPISVTVSLFETSKTATITADNTAPELTLEKPTSGFWFYNSRLLPLKNTIILGPIEIQVTGSTDIAKVEFYIDDELKNTDTEPRFEWYMNLKLRGMHKLTITVFDGAGNPTTSSQQVRVFNLFGAN